MNKKATISRGVFFLALLLCNICVCTYSIWIFRRCRIRAKKVEKCKSDKEKSIYPKIAEAKKAEQNTEYFFSPLNGIKEVFEFKKYECILKKQQQRPKKDLALASKSSKGILPTAFTFFIDPNFHRVHTLTYVKRRAKCVLMLLHKNSPQHCNIFGYKSVCMEKKKSKVKHT